MTDELAAALVADPQRGLPQPLQVEPLALAWALKAVCFAAWSKAPARAVRCAALLADLQLAAQGRPVAEQTELAALAHWVQGIAHLSEGRAGPACDSLDAAHAAFWRLGQSSHAAQTRVPKVMALSLLGEHDAAIQCGQDALQQFLTLGDELAAGKIEVNLGTLATRQDRHADAARLFRSAAVRGARARDRGLSIHADIALANALTWLSDFDEAMRINRRARMRAETHGLAVVAALADGAIGRIRLHRGHYHAALRALAEASRGFAEAGASPQQCIEAEAALADAYSAVNLLPEALALYDKVAARALEIDAPVERARAALDGARALLRLGHGDAALQRLAQARQLFEAQGNAASVAVTDLALASAELRAGRPADALDSAERASTALARSGVTSWLLEAEVAGAEAAAALGLADQARRRLQRALQQAQLLDLGAVTLACHQGLGRLAAGLGDGAQARQHLHMALALIDRSRVALQGDSFRAAIGAQAEEAHDLLVRLALQAGDPAPALLLLMEQGRARALALGVQDRSSLPPDPALDLLRQKLQWARDQWRQAVANGDQPLEPLARRVTALEQALLDAHLRAQLRDQPQAPPPAGRPPTDGAAPFDAAALQAALPAGTALVAFHLLDGELLAVVATAQQVRHHLQPVPGLDQRLAGLRFQLDGQRCPSPSLQVHAALLLTRVQTHLQALHRLVWAGLEPLLQGCERVVVVPHRSLHYLPFAALHDGQHWLVERHEISMAPSATLWLAGQGTAPRQPCRALVVGHADQHLPHVATELHAVAQALGGKARILQGGAATQDALRAALAGQDVLHLACHGQFRADNPSFSSLELADGALTLLDAQRLPVAGMLVALSACETGLSHVAPGDELLGLVRGFLLAGAPTVLASLWMVDDASTARLMRGFYSRLGAGMRPAAALRAAQREMALAGVHPFHWAAFALHGQA